jgi:hypothetical protein
MSRWSWTDCEPGYNGSTPRRDLLPPTYPERIWRTRSLLWRVNAILAAGAWKLIPTLYYRILWESGTAVAQWLGYWATNRKVAGSIPDGVIGIFHWYNPSDRTMALGSTHPQIEMSTTWAFPGGKGGRRVRLATLPPSCAVIMYSGNLKFLEPSGPLQACNGTALPFYWRHVTTPFLPTFQQTVSD